MGKYLKKFNSHAEYNAFTATTAFILPNVSLCVNEDDLHYNPLVRVSGVTLDKSELSIKEGDTETLVASVLPYNASNKNVTWSSSDDSVATVDNGVVSGVAVGNTNITVTTEDGGYTAQCATSVKNYKVITYTATAKLPETTSTSSGGLHTNSFSGTSGQKLTMVSHTFDNGVGTVTFNGDIAKFGDYAFYTCSGIRSIVIPDSVTYIGNNAFQHCTSLTAMNIPDSVESIGDAAFYGCSGLTSIDIPDSVTSIGASAFTICYKLTSCTISNGVTSIGDYTFLYCSGLTSIDIPDSVTSIGYGAFQRCSGLTSCTLGNGVTSIGNNTFSNCRSLTSIDIPDNVTSIGNGTFQGCVKLSSCTISNGAIGDSAFEDCSELTNVTIGSGVTSIGQDAFRQCVHLSRITSNAMIAPSIQYRTFMYFPTNGVLYVPIGSSGYDTWMSTDYSYLGYSNWTKVEQ